MVKTFTIFATLILTIGTLPIFNLFTNSFDLSLKDSYKTDNIEGLTNFFLSQNLNLSSNSSKVIVGKNGWLFLGNDTDRILDRHRGLINNGASAQAQRIQHLQKWYETRKINFLLVIAPNKHSIYHENLPAFAQKRSTNYTDDLMRFLQTDKINAIDLRDDLIKHKNKGLYYKYDSHWNPKGAYIALGRVLKKLNELFSLRLRRPKVKFVPGIREPDLARMLKMQNFLEGEAESTLRYQVVNAAPLCKGDYLLEQNKPSPCLDFPSNSEVGVRANGNYVRNSNASNEHNVLIIGDSFGTSPSPLYNHTFKTIWRFHYSYLKPTQLDTFIKQNDINLVIYQIVERKLSNSDWATLPSEG